MSTISTLPGRVVAVLLGIISLSACQRASYSFQKASVMAPSLVAPEAVVSLRSGHSLSVLAVVSSRVRSVRRARPPSRPHCSPAAIIVRRQPIATRLAAAAVARHLQRPAPAATVAEEPVKQRSRAIAILLAALAITYLPLSLHNFYLGYYGRGAAAIGLLVVSIYLLLIGGLSFLAASSSLAAVGYIGQALLAGWFLWQLSDLVRIITGELKPKNGEYRSKKARL